MSVLVGVVATLGVTSSLAWLAHASALVRHRRRFVRLADLPDEPPEGGWPSLAILFAARDEAGSIEAAARSMTAQDVPGLEVVAVDDRSTDGTGSILDDIASADPRLRVLHVRELPPGWLGKTRSLQLASEATGADWILFTDADVLFAPGALARALAFVAREDVDHVVVLPEVPTETIGERLFLSFFGLVFAMKASPWKVEDPSRRASIGIGAFNLARAESFRAIGGFRRLALSVDDDRRLGQALKFAGYRGRVLVGAGAVSVRWQVGLWALIRGLEKNFFGAADYRLPAALAALFAMFWVGIAPYLGLFVGPIPCRLTCGAGVLAIAACLAAVGPHCRIGWGYAFTLPLAALICGFTLARSAWLTLRRGGVRWRGHLYPLAELRRHVRMRNAWLREVWLSTRPR